MFGIFEKQKWELRSADELIGSYEGLRVKLNDFPYRVNLNSGKRKLPQGGFGNQFITQLTERKLPKFDAIMSQLNSGRAVHAQVQVEGLPTIRVEVSGKSLASSKEFYSDLADALIHAFKSGGIG